MEATDDDDFSAYVAARWAALVRVATYLGCSPPEAEDIVQVALLRCYRSWSRVRRVDRVDAYVHRTVVTTFRKARRRHWHGEVPAADLPEGEGWDPTSATEARVDLLRVLHGLTPDHRAVLVLRFVSDLTEQQTAEVLGVPVGTVKSRVARALAAVDRRDLAEEMP